MDVKERYDVIIVGAGLAGLTLALQLKQANSTISILLLEKRKTNAPAATHKVGESISELAASYLREVLNLKEHLDQHQLPKFGFRFFLDDQHALDLDRRVEIGSKISNPYPSHQIDRGLLENSLIDIVRNLGADVLLGVSVHEVQITKTLHHLFFTSGDEKHEIKGSWMVDASGRSGFLKRKFSLKKDINHFINAAWFRLDAVVDVDDWSENLAWRKFAEPGRRRLATNHLMGEGYWVWIIPLVAAKTSIGIVADPRFHPIDDFNTFEKAMSWLEKFEPLAALMLADKASKLMDFKVMKNFAYDTSRFYADDKWAVTGEAGAFMDPLYSPGSDMIALGNSWITELITRQLAGEDITLRISIYNFAHKDLVDGWILLYRNMYGLFGKTQLIIMKIIWDWASYWAIPNVMFINNGYTNLTVLKQYSSSGKCLGRRFAKLNERMQDLFQLWGKHDMEQLRRHQLNVFDLHCLVELQLGLGVKHEPAALISKIDNNLQLLEKIAAEIFRLVSNHLNGTPVDMDVDPYNMRINESNSDLITGAAGDSALCRDESIKNDLSKMWLIKSKTAHNDFA